MSDQLTQLADTLRFALYAWVFGWVALSMLYFVMGQRGRR